ncbi:MAG: M23 family metallopeptidase [Treponemataceae bacterium]|nr:M23 family metallopeptidase [Treponemataceae bacterium]
MKRFERFFIYTILFALILLEPLFCADWPVDLSSPKSSSAKTQSSSIRYNFGENREGYFVPGFVFSSPESDVKAFSDGKIIYKNDASSSYYEDFPSALGSTLIVAHPDKMISVYSNLSEIKDDSFEDGNVQTGNVIAKVSPDFEGLGGFHDKHETLEFQVIDTQSHVAINSYIILPKIQDRLLVYPGSLYLQNKKGTVYSLDERKVLPNGFYSIYRDFSAGRMPLSTSVFVNGKNISTINYDMLLSKNGFCQAGGKTNYPFSTIFALPKKQFLGEVQLIRGKNEITLTVTDFDKNERKITYIIDIY